MLNDIASRAIAAVGRMAPAVLRVDLKEEASGRPLVTEINAGFTRVWGDDWSSHPVS